MLYTAYCKSILFLMKHARFIFLIISALASHAGVYKWVDENGKVHYGDRPAAGDSSLEMSIDTTSSVPSAEDEQSREEKRERLLRAMEEDRLELQQEREKQQAKQESYRKKCVYYRDKMRQYERASGIYKLDMNGSRVYMSDSEREKSTRQLQARINKYCR